MGNHGAETGGSNSHINSDNMSSYYDNDMKNSANKVKANIVNKDITQTHENTVKPRNKASNSRNSSTKNIEKAGSTSKGNKNGSTETGDPIRVVTGSFYLPVTDLKLKDIGEEVVFSRNYESTVTKTGLMGKGWSFNFEIYLEINDDVVTVFCPNNHFESFVKNDNSWENIRNNDLSYHLSEEDEQYILTFPDKKDYHFDNKGILTCITDKNGNRLTIERSGNQILRIITPGMKTVMFDYQGDKIKRMTDLLGRTVEYFYDGDFLISVKLAHGGKFHYTYNENGFLDSVTDPNGTCYVKNTYDKEGRVIRQDLGDGNFIDCLYDVQNMRSVFTYSYNGRIEEYKYNHEKLVTEFIYNGKTDKSLKYDEWENPIEEIDGNGNITKRKYNQSCMILEEEHPNGLITQYSYDDNDNLIKTTDNAGRKIEYEYNNFGNLTMQKVYLGEDIAVTKYDYDRKGRVISIINPNGGKIRFEYDDNLGNPIRYINELGYIFKYYYDKAERRMSVSSDLGTVEFAYNRLDYNTVHIDAEGNTTQYLYDMMCNLKKEILPNQYDSNSFSVPGTVYEYNSFDKLISRTDAVGNVYAVQCDFQGHISKEINANAYNSETKDGDGIEYHLDYWHNKMKTQYPDGGTARYFYDNNNNLIKSISPMAYDKTSDDGDGYIYEYDSQNRLKQITSPDGTVTRRCIYDLAGNLIKDIDAKGYLYADNDNERYGKIYKYDLAGRMTEKREPVSEKDGQMLYSLCNYIYDRMGNVIEEVRYNNYQTINEYAGIALNIYFEYDLCNRLIKVSDSLGAAAEYEYDCVNRRTKEKKRINDNAFQIEEYIYNKAGRISEIKRSIEKNGGGLIKSSTKYTYDKTGNITEILLPEGGKIRREYDAANKIISERHLDSNGIDITYTFEYDKEENVISVRDSNDISETFEYDLMNREIRHKLRNGGIERKLYDLNGNLSKHIKPEQYSKNGENADGYTYSYDRQDRIIKITAPDGTVLESNTYDKNGNILSKQDSMNSGLSYLYDAGNREVKIQTSGGSRQEYEYDAAGNITGIIDGNSNRTQYRLDKWGRIVEITKADGTKEHYTYDYAGNITSTEDGNGNIIKYIYGRSNRLEKIIDQDGNAETFAYDLQNRLSEHTDRNGSIIKYSYNIYDSITSKWEQNSGQRYSYEFYPNGWLKSAIAEGMRYGYSYYEDGRLKEKSASGRTLLSFEYDLNGNKTLQKDVTGKNTIFSYNSLDMLTSVCDNENKLAEYSYNPDGTIRTLKQTNGLFTEYGYDADKNLTSMSTMFNENSLVNNSYRYDGNGNRTKKHQLGGDTYYTYDSLNRLVKADYPNYSEELYYDKVGNRSKRLANNTEELYGYDKRNRLVRYVQNGNETLFEYDLAGNLLKDDKAVYSYDGFNKNTKVETFDGNIQINRYDAELLRYEIEENGRLVQFIFNDDEVVCEKTSEHITRMIRGYELIASDCESARTYYHYLSDEQLSITHVCDDENVLNRYEYDAFGNAVLCEEAVSNRFRYNGQQFDSVTQQYYLRARFYNPVIARFTQEDIYRGDGLNLYAYCDNNSVNYYDPSGFNCQELLPYELSIDTYYELHDKYKASKYYLTPHHMPSKLYMEKNFSICKDDGLCMALETTYNNRGSRHGATKTYGRPRKDDDYFTLSPRDALERDLRDLINILKNHDPINNYDNKDNPNNDLCPKKQILKFIEKQEKHDYEVNGKLTKIFSPNLKSEESDKLNDLKNELIAIIINS